MQGSNTDIASFNLLKPACYVMQQQFNIQHLYVLPTLYLCNIYVIQQDTQYLMINFVHNIQ